MNTLRIADLESGKKSQIGKAGLRMFFNLAIRWGLNQEQQITLLGLSSRSTLREWKQKAANDAEFRVSVDALERLSLIVGIRKGVEMLYPEDRWDSYMHVKNRYFGGRSMVEVMLEGSMKSLYDARQYLDANRGAHFG